MLGQTRPGQPQPRPRARSLAAWIRLSNQSRGPDRPSAPPHGAHPLAEVGGLRLVGIEGSCPGQARASPAVARTWNRARMRARRRAPCRRPHGCSHGAGRGTLPLTSPRGTVQLVRRLAVVVTCIAHLSTRCRARPGTACKPLCCGLVAVSATRWSDADATLPTRIPMPRQPLASPALPTCLIAWRLT